MLTSGTAENEDGVEDAHLNVAVSLVTRKERDRIDCDDKIGVKRSTLTLIQICCFPSMRRLTRFHNGFFQLKNILRTW